MILKGDCHQIMKAMKPNSVDAIVHICPVCDKEFKKKVYKKVQAVYCSQECAYKGRTLGFTKRNISKLYQVVGFSIVRIKKICKICGKYFSVIPSRVENKYCSRKCFEISHKERMKGENNPSYINGNSYNKRSWRGGKWEELRKAIYERDGWICQECGKHCEGREIQCHHIEPYKINQNNNPDNLITLCVSCHGQAGRKCIGIEKEDEYLTIAKRRIDYWKNQPKQMEMGL